MDKLNGGHLDLFYTLCLCLSRVNRAFAELWTRMPLIALSTAKFDEAGGHAYWSAPGVPADGLLHPGSSTRLCVEPGRWTGVAYASVSQLLQSCPSCLANGRPAAPFLARIALCHRLRRSCSTRGPGH